jgi:hypothetical protein
MLRLAEIEFGRRIAAKRNLFAESGAVLWRAFAAKSRAVNFNVSSWNACARMTTSRRGQYPLTDHRCHCRRTFMVMCDIKLADVVDLLASLRTLTSISQFNKTVLYDLRAIMFLATKYHSYPLSCLLWGQQYIPAGDADEEEETDD